MKKSFSNREKKQKRIRRNTQIAHLRKYDYKVTRGVIHVHSRGFGFVSSDDSQQYPEDIFIPKHLKKGAIDGDFVEIAVYAGKYLRRSLEGYVIDILERTKKHLVGVVWTINVQGDYILYVHSLGEHKKVIVKQHNDVRYRVGDRLFLKIIDWGNEREAVLCMVMEKIGTIEHAQTDILFAIKGYGIRDVFPPAVMQQVKQFSKTVDRIALRDRLDCTDLEAFTIDPDHAQDFDDALTLSEDHIGHFCLGIHIADVAHYVREGTPLDAEAKKRSNSTYFPGQTIPMLPEALSNHLCSLKENTIRLTLSVFITLNTEGDVEDYNIVRSYIKSRKRFTYKQVKDVLEKKIDSSHYHTLKQMETLYYLLKKKRLDRGSIDLAIPEIMILVDKKGKPYGYEKIEYDIAHQIVEEFMLKANETVAKDLASKNLPSVYRIHEHPSTENLEDFYALARSLGFVVQNNPTGKDIQALFSLAKTTPHAQQLFIAYIRSMNLAMYSHQNIGHYGLALEAYCHFTSPIRRYSDLIIHRLLVGEAPPKDIDKISNHCSEQERSSFKAEMCVINLKKLRLLQEYQKNNPQRIYKAIVNKLKPFGLFFEVIPLQLEGFIHISNLEDDYYSFQSKTQILVGKNSGRCFKIGETLDLLLEKVDMILTKATWKLKNKTRKSR